MNPKKADNIAYIYGLKERKRLVAVKESNVLIGVAVAASKANEKEERKRLAAVHIEGTRNCCLRLRIRQSAIKTAYRASTNATILFVFCILVLLLYTICSIAKKAA
jgi:hypothetical protein